MIELCYEAKQIEVLVETMSGLAKKRSLVKQAVAAMIQRGLEYVLALPDDAQVKYVLIDAIREVTEGKIFVEVERARVTRLLAGIREGEGRIKEAAELMQELQVETFGSMEKRERIDFILEQFRLLLAVKEYSQAQIVSRKISLKAFEAAGFEDLKIKYFTLMIALCLQERKYLEATKFHFQIWEAAGNAENLKQAALLAVLAQWDHEQSDWLNRIYTQRALEDNLAQYKAMLKLFLTKELIQSAQIDQVYTTLFRGTEVFAENEPVRMVDLKDRVIEHNLRVISGSFRAVRLPRLAEILGLSLEATEACLCRLITERMLLAKIDRVAGTVTFGKAQPSPEDTLNSWASRTDALLSLLVRTNHTIAKEELSQTL